MKPIANYEDVEVNDYKRLKAGAYICVVTAAEVTTSKAGKDMLVINFDIADGEYKDYFKNKYMNAKPYSDDQVIKWQGVYRLMLDGNNWESRFKAFMTSLEKSNDGFKWLNCNWDESKLRGLKFGGIFREEEFNSNYGISSSVKLYQVRSVKAIEDGDYTIPEPKRLLPAEDFNYAPTDNSDIPF